MAQNKAVSSGVRNGAGRYAYDEYRERLDRIVASVCEIAQRAGRFGVRVEIDSVSQKTVRTSHTVRIRHGSATQDVVLSKEEFFDEFDLFRRSALPKLGEAVRRLGIQ